MKKHIRLSSDLKKASNLCFITILITVGVILFCNEYNAVFKKEELQPKENNNVSLIKILDLPVSETLENTNTQEALEIIDIQEEPKEIVEEYIQEYEEEDEIEINTLYYVNDNNYRSYLHEDYQDFLYEMCIKYDVKEYYKLFIAQMYHESTFRTNLISGTNDYGLMQINSQNHNWLREKFGFTDFLDPYVSIESGVYIMSLHLHKYKDVEKALVCYNMGESAVTKRKIYSSTYSRGVLEDLRLLVVLN